MTSIDGAKAAHAARHAPGQPDDLTTALSATVPPVGLSATAAVGTGTGFSRQGHVHPTTGLPADPGLVAAFGSSAADSTARLMTLLHSETRDTSGLFLGDSTGNEVTEWIYLLAVSIAADWPRWTVVYRLWNDGTLAYDAPITVQTGTGSRTLTIYNASVAGFTTDDWQGSRAAAAIYALTPDLMVLSLGHNEQILGADLWHSRYVALTESLTEGLPSADLLLVMQNPESANTYQQQRWDVYREIAARRGYGLVEVGQAFLDTDPALTSLLLGDGIHPNATGSALWRDTVKPAFIYRKGLTARPQQPSTLNGAAEQLLVNGDFAAFAGAVPDSWTLTNATTSKDVTNYESGNGYAVKVTATATGGTFGQYIPINRAKGRWVTVAVRLFVPLGASASVGRVGITDSIGSTLGIGFTAGGMGRYRWAVASRFVATTATNCRVLIYADSSAGLGNCTIDRIIMTIGKYPRTAANAQPGLVGPPGPVAAGFDHLSTMGGNPALSQAANSPFVMGGANQGIFVAVIPSRNVALALLNWAPGAISGNYDIGIYDNSGNRLWSLGSTVVTSGAKVTTVSPTLNLVAGTTYWVGFTYDNTTAQIYGLSSAGGSYQGQLLGGGQFARTVSSVFPLPSTVTLGATGSAKLPLIVLREA